MKKLILFVVVAMMVLSASGVFAADDVTVTVGVKAWSNSWDRDQTFTGGSQKDKYGTSTMIGPALSLRLGHFLMAGSYMQSGKNYSHTDASFRTFENERTDTDFMIGGMFTPRVGMFLGYKSIVSDTTEMGVNVGTYNFTGPGIGVMGSVPLGSMVNLYGNIAFMSLKYKHTYTNGATPFERDVAGASGELGLALAMGEHFSGTLGYKMQDFSGSKDGLSVEDKFAGPTMGLNIRF